MSDDLISRHEAIEWLATEWDGMVTGENRYGEPVRYMRYRRAEDDDKSRA